MIHRFFNPCPAGDVHGILNFQIVKLNFVGKFMGMIFNMDKMVGKDFEAGLVNLKSLVEQN